MISNDNKVSFNCSGCGMVLKKTSYTKPPMCPECGKLMEAIEKREVVTK